MAFLLVQLLFLCMQAYNVNSVEYKLDGASYIVYSMHENGTSVSKVNPAIHMLFRTAEASGILVHGRGENGDFFTVEIVRGKLRYASVSNGDGSNPVYYDVVVGDDLNDEQWHQIDIERDYPVVVKLDITKEPVKTRRKHQSINRYISVARLPPHTTKTSKKPAIPYSLTGSIFQGCIEDVSYGKINILKATKEKSKLVNVFGNLESKCADEVEYFPPATLSKTTSYIELNIPQTNEIRLKMQFRAFDHSGILVHLTLGLRSNNEILIELKKGKLQLNCNSKDRRMHSSSAPKTSTFTNGLWHSIRFSVSSDTVVLQINNDSAENFKYASCFKQPFGNGTLTIGSNHLEKSSMLACVKGIEVNGEKITVASSIWRDVDLDKCYLTDVCFNNPCQNNGTCSQHNNIVQCDCGKSRYFGSRCENISRHPENTDTESRRHKTSYTEQETIFLRDNIKPTQEIHKVAKTISKNNTRDARKSQQLEATTTQEITHTTIDKLHSRVPVHSPTIALPSEAHHISASTVFPQKVTYSLLPSVSSKGRPPATHPSIIIIKKTTEITNVGFNKHQLLVYLFIFVVFFMFVGLLVVISVKLGRFHNCTCNRRFRSASNAFPDYDSIELPRRRTKTRATKQRINARPSSLHDSGIDRSDSATDSNRNLADLNNETLKDDLVTQDDDSNKGSLILQEDPPLYTKESFGWSV